MTNGRRETRSEPGWLMTPWAISAGAHILIAGLLAWSLTGPPAKSPKMHVKPGDAGEVVATVRFLTAEQARRMKAGRTATASAPPIAPDAPPPISQPLASRVEPQSVEAANPDLAPVASLAPGETPSSVPAPPPIAQAAPTTPDTSALNRPIEPTAATLTPGVQTDHDAQLIDLPAPRYPPLSKRNGEQGVVIVEVVVNPEGTVDSARVIETPGHARLDSAALAAARAARFTPAKRNGQAVHATVRIPYRFVIEP